MERELDFLGLLALQDPPRPDVAESLATCRRAGIRVAMLTGDHPLTARRIATEVGLLSPGGVVLDGRDLPDDDTLAELLDTDHGAVVARVSPEDKLRIARGLRGRGHVVAMTGDGVNDAPALREADVGVAMGASGSDVARESADLVLLDDHFATIVRAIELGRATFENVRRFLTYHLTDNVAELARLLCAPRSTTRTSASECIPHAGLRGGSLGTSTASGCSRATPSADPARASGLTRASQRGRRPASRHTLTNDLDRGHIARRSDLLWGTLDEARQANSDSFFFTNITPQMADFNQSGRGGTWGLLKNAILALQGLEDRRLTVFAGPVLNPDDPPYRGIVQLPVEHWKAVAYRLDGQLRFKCFVLAHVPTCSNGTPFRSRTPSRSTGWP